MHIFRPANFRTDTIRYGFVDKVVQFLNPFLDIFVPLQYHSIHVKELAMCLRVDAELVLDSYEQLGPAPTTAMQTDFEIHFAFAL